MTTRCDYSEILPTLYQGAHPQIPSEIRKKFNLLVLCAKEHQDVRTFASPRLEVWATPLDDSGHPPTYEEIEQAVFMSLAVSTALTRRAKVLVCCHEGRNRSGLVCGLALRQLGWTGPQAISRIRTARGSSALSNPWFEDIIREYRHGRNRCR